MTTDPKNPLPPRLDPTCTCICHTQPGVMHVAPCCREADPRDAEIARLRMALDESEAAAEGALMILVQTRAERDAALAQVTGAYEAAAKIVADRYIKEVVSILTPADALAALSRRDAQMRAEGLRKAAEIAYRVCAETRHVTLGQEAERAILAAAEKEAGNG